MGLPVKRHYLCGFLVAMTLVGMAAQVASFRVTETPAAPATRPSATDIPTHLLAIYGPEDHAKAERFNRPLALGNVAVAFTVVLGLLAVLASGIANSISDPSDRPACRWSRVCLFLAGLYCLQVLLAAPFRIVSYLHYRIYDLTDMSFRAWFKVLALRFPVPLLLFVLMGVLVYCILQLFKRRWWIVAAALVFLTFKVAPELTRVRPADPEKELRPLQDADYRTGLSRVARTAGITLDLLVEDRSNREKTVSAYLGGRASNRYFALTDTFLAKFTPQEAGAALAHELGHKRHEMPYLLASKALTLLRLTLAFGLAFLLTRQTGDRETHPLQVVVVAVLCLSLAGDLFLPADRAVSRWDERFADRYALELTGDPDTYASLLLKGSKLNLERWESPAWEYYLFAGYPSVRDRVAEALRHGHGH